MSCGTKTTKITFEHIFMNIQGGTFKVLQAIYDIIFIVPYFINETLNSIKDDNFICNDLRILLEDVQLNIRRVI